ncbi:MAG: hypothetical protein CVT95_12490 [Bacteroidetes bacterium HGW-Bacteroidetes-12]|nr:MAG: hypothetical protein CVT95_12490 [Bacteroidetes bacterium HGW-Bacteroidetes-12]
MPTIYEYFGIMILFYSDEHEPIHVHAKYGDSVVKVSFFLKEGKIYRTTFAEINGKFPPQKMKQHKKFVSVYKWKIVLRWDEYFIYKKSQKKEVITKKIKNEDSYN